MAIFSNKIIECYFLDKEERTVIVLYEAPDNTINRFQIDVNYENPEFLELMEERTLNNNLLISTSVNGEAVATGTAIMDFAASDVFFVTGFHTGATGGSGNQGFPVSNNTLFNEPMLWMIKIG